MMTRTAKVRSASENPTSLLQLPNIGPAAAEDLRIVGIHTPDQLLGRDPLELFRELQERTRSPQDPCVLDVLISAVRFMEGAEPHPWWHYTKERKRLLRAIAS